VEQNFKVNLFFPIAGQGARFGYSFKPFLDFEGKTFIEQAVLPFVKWKDQIECIYFVFLKEQNEKFQVEKKLSGIFKNLPVKCIILNAPTKGPAETFYNAVENLSLESSAIICDCDHSINIDPMMQYLIHTRDLPEIILPLWDLEVENINSWSVVNLSEDGNITAVAEKSRPETPGKNYGVIGCYFLKKITLFKQEYSDYFENFSDYIKLMIDRKFPVKGVKIEEAIFFGDPERLEKAKNNKI